MASYFLLQFFHQGGERSGRYKIASELEVAPFGRKKILKTFLTEQKIKIKLVRNKTTLLCLVQFFVLLFLAPVEKNVPPDKLAQKISTVLNKLGF